MSLSTIEAIVDILRKFDQNYAELPACALGRLLLLHAGTDSEDHRGFALQVLGVNLHVVPHRHQDLPAVLRQTATAIGGPAEHRPDGALNSKNVVAVREQLAAPAMLLAWAIRYDDVHIQRGQGYGERDTVHVVYRTDVLDIDGRVYQVTRRPGDRDAAVDVDDPDGPSPRPATVDGLKELHVAGGRPPRGQHRGANTVS